MSGAPMVYVATLRRLDTAAVVAQFADPDFDRASYLAGMALDRMVDGTGAPLTYDILPVAYTGGIAGEPALRRMLDALIAREPFLGALRRVAEIWIRNLHFTGKDAG